MGWCVNGTHSVHTRASPRAPVFGSQPKTGAPLAFRSSKGALGHSLTFSDINCKVIPTWAGLEQDSPPQHLGTLARSCWVVGAWFAGSLAPAHWRRLHGYPPLLRGGGGQKSLETLRRSALKGKSGSRSGRRVLSHLGMSPCQGDMSHCKSSRDHGQCRSPRFPQPKGNGWKLSAPKQSGDARATQGEKGAKGLPRSGGSSR